MIHGERLLGALIRGGLRRGRGRGTIPFNLGLSWKTAAGLGILGVAIGAFDHFMQSRRQTLLAGPADRPAPMPPPPPPDSPPKGTLGGGAPLPQPARAAAEAAADRDALLLVRVMIAAANADGRIDVQEQTQILKRLEEQGAGPEERQFILRELASPPSIDTLLGQVDTRELGLQMYAAALLAIDANTPAEKHFLNYLRNRLELDPEKVEALHRELGLESSKA